MKEKAAVVGRPIAHSLSPRIFSMFAAELGRDLEYSALEVGPEALEDKLKACGPGWVGWNVTLPHKLAAARLADRLDASAQEAGAANVLHFTQSGRVAYNTDAEGFLAPLKARRFQLKGRKAVVLGAGGAARAVCLALRREGVGDLRVLNRTAERAQELASAFGAQGSKLGGPETALRVSDADLVVNATSLGLDELSSPLPQGARFKPGALAYDLVYRPAITPFLRSARNRGAGILGGMAMLAAQAAATWRIWFGQEVPAALVRRVQSELEESLS